MVLRSAARRDAELGHATNTQREPTPTAPLVVVGVVLAGGASRRMGADKAATVLGGRSLLQHVLDGLGGVPVVVVGPAVAVDHPNVRFTLEKPAGGGPCAALVAGVKVAALMGGSIVAVVATDMPRGAAIALEAARRLASNDHTVDAVIPIDANGEGQPLCAAYRVEAVRDWAVGWEGVTGAPVRSLTAALRVVTWSPIDATDALRDIDDAADLAQAQAALDAPNNG